MRDLQTISTNAARRRQAKVATVLSLYHRMPHYQRRDRRVSTQLLRHRVSRWRVMRLALELLFAEQTGAEAVANMDH